MPWENLNEFWRKVRATAGLIGSIALDVVFILAWVFLMHFARKGFDDATQIFGAGSALEPSDEWFIETGHTVLNWATLGAAVLYIAYDLVKTFLRMVEDIRRQQREYKRRRN